MKQKTFIVLCVIMLMVIIALGLFRVRKNVSSQAPFYSSAEMCATVRVLPLQEELSDLTESEWRHIEKLHEGYNVRMLS